MQWRDYCSILVVNVIPVTFWEKKIGCVSPNGVCGVHVCVFRSDEKSEIANLSTLLLYHHKRTHNQIQRDRCHGTNNCEMNGERERQHVMRILWRCAKKEKSINFTLRKPFYKHIEAHRRNMKFTMLMLQAPMYRLGNVGKPCIKAILSITDFLFFLISNSIFVRM